MLEIRFLAATEGEFLSGIFTLLLSGVDVLRFRSAPTPKVEQPRQNGSEAEGWAQCKPR